MKKRMICFLLTVLMTLTMIPAVSATDDPGSMTFEVQAVSAEAKADSIVSVEIALTQNTGYIAGTLDVEWNNEAFSLADVAYSEIAPKNTATDDPGDPEADSEIANTGSYRIFIGDHITQGIGNFTGTGTCLTLSFRILSGASEGEYPITIGTTDFMETDISAPELIVNVTDGSITLTTPESESKALLGDVDGNGKVNIFDASAIQKSLAGTAGSINYSVLEPTDEAFIIADADGNGKVNIFDASLIQKWLAGDASAQSYGIGQEIDG